MGDDTSNNSDIKSVPEIQQHGKHGGQTWTDPLVNSVEHQEHLYFYPPLSPSTPRPCTVPLPQAPTSKTELKAVFLSCYQSIPRILGGIADLHSIHVTFCQVVPSLVCKNKKLQQISEDRATAFPFGADTPRGSVFFSQAVATLPT